MPAAHLTAMILDLWSNISHKSKIITA